MATRSNSSSAKPSRPELASVSLRARPAIHAALTTFSPSLVVIECRRSQRARGKAVHGPTAPRGHVAPRHPAVPSGNLGCLFLRPCERTLCAPSSLRSNSCRKLEDERRMRSALRLLVHPAGPQKQPSRATCPDCEEQSAHARLCRQPPHASDGDCRAGEKVLIGAWIAGRARNDA